MSSDEGTNKRAAPSDAVADKATAGGGKLTPLRRQVGRERMRDPSASEAAIIRRAGGSEWTARAARRNGIDSWQHASEVAREGPIDPAQIENLALSVLAELAESKAQPGSTRGAAAKTLLDYSNAFQKEVSDLAESIRVEIEVDEYIGAAISLGVRVGAAHGAKEGLLRLRRGCGVALRLRKEVELWEQGKASAAAMVNDSVERMRLRTEAALEGARVRPGASERKRRISTAKAKRHIPDGEVS